MGFPNSFLTVLPTHFLMGSQEIFDEFSKRLMNGHLDGSPELLLSTSLLTCTSIFSFPFFLFVIAAFELSFSLVISTGPEINLS